MLYWNCCVIRTCFLGITEENSKTHSSIFSLVLLTRQLRGVLFSKGSQVCHIMIYDTNYLRKHWQNILFFLKKRTCKTWWSYHDHGMNHGKHDNHTMIMPWIMVTMLRNGRHAVIKAWSWTCFSMIMVWSWQDHAMAAMFSNPGRLVPSLVLLHLKLSMIFLIPWF